MNMQRIIETLISALITAIVTAVILVYAASLVLGERMQSVQNDIKRIEASVTRINNDFYPPLVRGYSKTDKSSNAD